MDEGILIWLRSNDTSDPDEIILKENVGKFIDDIRIFDDVDDCINELSCFLEEKVFLWLGYGLSYLVSTLNDFNQILYMYLSEPVEYTATIKIRGVFPDCKQLFNQLERDIQIWKHSHAYLTFCDIDSRRMETTTTQDIQNNAARFMWSQMLLETLLHIPSPLDNPHKDLLKEARRLYANNHCSLKTIDQFEREYQEKDAIQWYTRDSFLYRLVNKALRTRDICLIFKFRFLIQHIHRQLKDEQEKTSSNFQLPMTLYRGQLMTLDEFDQIQRNTKQLISVNTFLSTSKDRQTALVFSGQDFTHLDLISVIFEILIEPTCDISCLPPFADISRISDMKDENEILLSMGTVMQVTSVNKINPTNGVVYLRLMSHDDDPGVNQMKDYLYKEIRKLGRNETSYIDQLSMMLMCMGENKKAEQMLKLIESNEHSVDNPARALLTYTARLNDQILTSESTKPILEKEQRKLSDMCQDLINHPAIPVAFKTTAEDAMDYFLHPLEKFDTTNKSSVQSNQHSEQSIESFVTVSNSLFPSTHPSMVDLYYMLAKRQTDEGKYLEAIEYYQKALNVCETSLDKTHSFHTLIPANMASIYMKMNDDSRAEQLIQRCQSHQSTSPIASIFALRVSTQFFEKRRDWHAVIACQRDILQISQTSPNSPDTVCAHMVIGDAYYKLHDFDSALTSLQTALDLQLQHQSINHPLTIKIQQFMVTVNNTKYSYQAKCSHKK